VLFDLVAQASTAAPENLLKGRGENEIAFDHLHRATLAGEVISEDPRDVSPGDAS
jgi:hypothetical protein